jgi:uncharacterized DUF497 family protein
MFQGQYKILGIAMLPDLEWDDAKNLANRAKHGVAFEAIHGMDWAGAVITADTRLDYGEDRFILRGLIAGRLYVGAFVLRGRTLRLISLRKANRREVRTYEAETGTRLWKPG